MEKSIVKQFVKYVSLNIMGMLGISLYILVDTFFVAKALGTVGIAALNFTIPVFSLILAIGLMTGIGGATRYSILKAQKEDDKANRVFTTCIKAGVSIGVSFAIIGILGSKHLSLLLGADSTTLPLARTYLATILCFAPFFIINKILTAFVRNDNNPKLSMIAMLTSSFSNIVLDYVFMFPLKMGMFGAALATGISPLVSMLLISSHFIKKKNNFRMVKCKFLWTSAFDIFRLGISSFISEISTALVIITFNMVILNLEGTVGVASYGIITNIALVSVCIFTGIAQGIQPLISKGHGLKNHTVLKTVLRYAILTSLGLAFGIYAIMLLYSDNIVRVFNSEQNLIIAQLAKTGLRIYFIGFIFAGINIILSAYLSAIEQAKNAFIISISRGCLLIIPLGILLSGIWGIKGVWFAFVLTEFIVSILSLLIIQFSKKVIVIRFKEKIHV